MIRCLRFWDSLRNWLWRHQQTGNRMNNEEKVVIFMVIHGMSYENKSQHFGSYGSTYQTNAFEGA